MNQDSFTILPEDMRPLVALPGGCIATNRITREGRPVRFMYRSTPINPQDSGWCFFSGYNENDEYLNDPANSAVYTLNTIANYDQTVIPYLESPVGSVFEKLQDDGEWQVVTDFEIPT